MPAEPRRPWARTCDRCRACGTRDLPHRARGLCRPCYNRSVASRYKPSALVPGASRRLTREFLLDEYVGRKRSVIDIARQVGCAAQTVSDHLRRHGIQRRSRSEARLAALRHGKIGGQRASEVDATFFETWTPQMAYVLGVIATDGCLTAPEVDARSGHRKSASVLLTQREPELLFKVCALLEAKPNIGRSRRREYKDTVAGEVFVVRLGGLALYERLGRLGLTARKSRTLAFPNVPEACLRHFVRGCWDGDGSIYRSTNGRSLVASFVTGSEAFINGLCDRLARAGLDEPRVYVDRRQPERPSYQIKITGAKAVQFCRFLYDGVPESELLLRKYKVFRTFVSAPQGYQWVAL